MNTNPKTQDDTKLLSKREIARLRMHRKYEPAVKLYAESNLPLREIAAKYGFNSDALGNYLRRYQRELVLRRHHISTKGRNPKNVKIISAGERSETAHEKYKNAVMACDSMEYIEYNVSQIARKFGLNGTALASYMRIHNEDIPVRREKIRQQMGICDHAHHGMRKKCKETYAEAVEMYRTSNMTIPQIAEKCGISAGGFSQHLRFYHKDILQKKREERRQAQGTKRKERGSLLGNGRENNPLKTTEQKYAKALELYKESSLTMKEIAEKTAVPLNGFRFYLHKWHKDLVLKHWGVTEEEGKYIDLRSVRTRKKNAQAKETHD